MKLKKAILIESLIMLILLGGGSLLTIVDCFSSRHPVINTFTGTASSRYFPTILGGIGIIIFLLYPLYLLTRFIVWGIKKGLKRFALFCLIASLSFFATGCYDVKDEVILAGEAVAIPGLPTTYMTYTITPVPGSSDYRFTNIPDKDSPPESGCARAILLRDNIYIVQVKYDNYANYMVIFPKFTNDANGKELRTVFPEFKVEPSQYNVRLEMGGFFDITLIGSRENIMAFLKAHANANFTGEPRAISKFKEKVLKAVE